MSIFFKRPEKRDLTADDVPWSPSTTWMGNVTADGLLSLVPVYSAIQLITNAISTLPLQQFRVEGASRVPVTKSAVFQYQYDNGGIIPWLQRPLISCLTKGDAFGLKIGIDPAQPENVVWLNPDDVTEHPNGVDWYWKGRMVPGDQMLHIPALSVAGQRRGVSPLTAARSAIESGLAAQTFMTEWMKNRALPSMVFTNKNQTFDADKAETISARLKAKLSTGKPLTVGNDWSLDVIKLGAEDAGFVTATRLSATQIASIYSLPPERIGGEVSGQSLRYANLEQDEIKFITDSLSHWIIKLEQAFSSLVPRYEYVRLNIDARLRLDAKTRWEIHSISRGIGTDSANDIRALEDKKPIPSGGDDYAPLRGATTTPGGQA